MAAELIAQAQQRGTLPATWLVCDEWFGRHRGLLERIDAAGLWYLAEVPRTTQVWPLREPTDGRRARLRPRAWLPPRVASGKGRLGTHERLHPDSPPAILVETLATQVTARRWQGWHHHMTTVILAHHFLVRLQRRLMQRGPPPSPTPTLSAGVREGGLETVNSGHAPGGTVLASAGRPVAQSGGGALLAASRTAAAYAGCPVGLGDAGLLATTQGGGVSFPP